jgi:sigma-B regulation protein RsbU (phosphoserine phosphatase)
MDRLEASKDHVPLVGVGGSLYTRMMAPHDSKLLLIVDDYELNRDMLTRRLRKRGYEVLEAESGLRALSLISDHPIDLVLLDENMPGMSGSQVLETLRNDKATDRLPVIMVTANSASKDIVKALELGADDYVTKPIDFPVALARIRTQLALQDAHAKLRAKNEQLIAQGKIIAAQKERMERELGFGRNVQMSMMPLVFPAFPEHTEFDVRGTLSPATELGGDFFDFFFVSERKLCFVIADVSGKGVAAALEMASSKTLINAMALTMSSTAGIITRVNDVLSENNESSMFVTLFLAILDIDTGDMVYSNAGHNPPYVVRKDGELIRLDARHGPVVGAMPGLKYGESTLRLSEQDIVVTYTDGVTEAMDPEGNLFSEDRLKQFLQTSGGATLEQLVDGVVGEIRTFERGAEQADDIAVLAIRLSEKTA